MKIKVIHIILLIILLLLIPILIFFVLKHSELSTKSSDEITQEIVLEDAFNKIDFDTFYASDLLKYYGSGTYGRCGGESGNSKYILYDFNGNDKLDCMCFNGETEIEFYELDGDEVSLVNSIPMGGSDNIDGYYYYLVKNRETGETEIFIHDEWGDGLCFEYECIFRIKYNNNKYELEELAYYVCDQDKEEELRKPIYDDNSLSEEEKELKIYNAHTLEYHIGEERVSEDEYNDYIINLKNSYDLLFRESGDFFNITKETYEELEKKVNREKSCIDVVSYEDNKYTYVQEYYATYDIDSDEDIDIVYIDNNSKTISVLLNDNGKLKIVKDFEYYLDLMSTFLLKNNETNTEEFYLDIAYACGNSGVSYIEKIEYNKDINSFNLLLISEHSDSEVEDDNDEYIETNTYKIHGKECSKEEYDKFFNDLKENYTVISNEHNDLFD